MLSNIYDICHEYVGYIHPRINSDYYDNTTNVPNEINGDLIVAVTGITVVVFVWFFGNGW
jgi:hypothetical protein